MAESYLKDLKKELPCAAFLNGEYALRSYSPCNRSIAVLLNLQPFLILWKLGSVKCWSLSICTCSLVTIYIFSPSYHHLLVFFNKSDLT